MKNVSYYFARGREESLNKLISDPLFNKIVTYFTEREGQEIILRQIKADISTDNNLELYLDKLINYNLVKRENRRYSLAFPIYSNETIYTIPDVLTDLLTSIRQDEVVTDQFLFGEWLWSVFFEEEQGSYFFGVKNESKNPPFFRRVEEGNEYIRFVSVYREDQVPLDLANYFHLLSQRQVLPQQFERLQTILGDVDIDYFIAQIQKVIRSVKRNKTRVSKKNIFQDALIETKDLIRNDEDQLIFETRFIEENVTSVDINRLKTELSVLWAAHSDENQRVFFKMQLFQQLIEKFLLDQETFHYFKYGLL
ncbi:hypothetical protein UAY_01550 [Enterococcus moraviensis ATCC BAA-383]|uniref:DUF1803 domain-containing protein n=1 Tax=Enterococcus moraviensis ATCC BAA-383 TaxID=1158609 RepID=R2TJY3_9ENTE|nr:DUF1803 domain-containing protein [Enterococcus moraviensis]EOI00447.1 hypothetical protein UAY_01550 [Enterococcus moraviensis ATCC BAA-383]EOT73324.1 hypothetical protein I586_00317 [Enterococcus moraviensis ATCC BAA-383]OJG68881.1 hypothetical protein RV09_GL000280 [Enterococcus moraviensis]